MPSTRPSQHTPSVRPHHSSPNPAPSQQPKPGGQLQTLRRVGPRSLQLGKQVLFRDAEPIEDVVHKEKARITVDAQVSRPRPRRANADNAEFIHASVSARLYASSVQAVVYNVKGVLKITCGICCAGIDKHKLRRANLLCEPAPRNYVRSGNVAELYIYIYI